MTFTDLLCFLLCTTYNYQLTCAVNLTTFASEDPLSSFDIVSSCFMGVSVEHRFDPCVINSLDKLKNRAKDFAQSEPKTWLKYQKYSHPKALLFLLSLVEMAALACYGLNL